MDKIQTNENQGRVADAPSHHWVYSTLPKAAWPYAQLARFDRPIGWQLLLWPCCWSVALAACVGAKQANWDFNPFLFIYTIALFTIGAIAMRGAGCTYNDLVDEKIDNKVARTRSRPLPAKQVTRRQAWLFLAAQALVGLIVLLQFNMFTIVLGLSSLIIVAIYPFAKRITDWPQFVLGLAFSWGALMGWAAHFGSLSTPAYLLYCGAVLWTIGYDTIYAHQDKEDDALVGVRSTARLFGRHTKLALTILYFGAIACFACATAAADAPLPAMAGLIGAAFHMTRQIRKLDIDDGDQCLTLFKSNTILGLLVFLGFLGAIIWAIISPMI